MAKKCNVQITIAGPPYTATFTDIPTRVHAKGHLWLNADSPNFTVNFVIQPGSNFTFDDGGTGNAKESIFTSAKPNPTKFDKCGNIFSDPALSNGNQSLSLGVINNDGQIYYYQLNFLDMNTNPPSQFSTTDPIMVNN